MSLKIRMSRAGTKKRPFYRIVVADSRSPRDGRFIERIGSYDPMLKDESKRITFDADRVKHWLGLGATPSDRCARFFSAQGLCKWEHGNNPQKAVPKAKAQERMKAAGGGEGAGAGGGAA